MSTLREIIASFSVDVDAKDLESFDKKFTDVVEKLQKFVAGSIVYKVGAAFATWIDDAREAGDEIAKTSLKLGMSTDALQEWRYAADLAGLGAEGFGAAATALVRNLDAAAGGSKEAAAAFQGIDFKDGSGFKSLDQLLPQLADKLQGISDPSKRAALAMQLFGKQGKELLPLMMGGAEGIAAAREEFRGLGAALDKDFVAASEEASDNISRMQYTFKGLRNQISTALMPAIDWFVRGITKLTKGFTAMMKHTNVLKIAFAMLGIAAAALAVKVAIAFAVPLATFAAIAAGVTFLILLVDDLIMLFTGGKSVIGDFIDSLFGVGSAAAVVETLVQYWDDLVMLIRTATSAVKDFLGWNEKADSAPSQEQVREKAVVDSRTRLMKERGIDPASARGRNILAGRQGTRAVAMPGSIKRDGSSNTVNMNSAPIITVNASGDAKAIAKQVKLEFSKAEMASMSDAYNALVPNAK